MTLLLFAQQRLLLLLVSTFVLLSSAASAADGYRLWKLQSGKTLSWPRKPIAVDGERVKLEHERDRSVQEFAVADFAAEDRRLLAICADPAGLATVQRVLELGNLKVTADGVEIHAANWRVTDADVQAFAKTFPDLTELSLSHCVISNEAVRALTPLKKLKHLLLPVIRQAASGVNNIEVNLQQRKFSKGTPIDPGLALIAQIESLEWLELSGNGSLSIGEHFAELQASKIKRLELRNCRLSAEDLQRIAGIPQLEYFSPGLHQLSTDLKPPLLKHLKGMKQLRVLDLMNAHLIDDDAQYLKEFPNLRELHIGNWTPSGIRELATLKDLEVLRILDPFDSTLRDADLAEIGKLTRLKTLWISSELVTDEGFAALANLTQLESLHLPSSLTAEGLKHLAKMKNLKHLGTYGPGIRQNAPIRLSEVLALLVGQHGRKPQEALHILDDELPAEGKLKRLDVQKWKLDLAAARYLRNLEVAYLDFEDPPLDDWLAAYESLTGVEKLLINGNRTGMRGDKPTKLKLSKDGLKHLAGWSSLAELNIWQCELAAGTLKPIADRKGLRKLSLNHSEVGPENLAVLPTLTELEELDLNGVKLKPADIAALAAFRNLQKLSFTEPASVDTLRSLKGLKKLERLEVPWAHVPFPELWKLLTDDFGRSPHDAVKLIFKVDLDTQGRVQELDLGQFAVRPRGTQFSAAEADSYLQMLQYLPQLRKLELPENVTNEALKELKHVPRLEWLELRSANVTDAGLHHLRHLEQLERINSTSTAITDQGLRELLKLPKIKYLVLWGSSVTDDGVKQAKEAAPQVAVHN